MCMKKLLLSLSMVVLTGTMAFAQYYHLSPAAGNPNNVNQEDSEYPVGGGLPATWTPILGAAQSAGTYTAAQTIPFTFLFNGNPVSSYRVSNTGIVTFSQVASPANNSAGNVAALNSSSVPDSSVCILGVNGQGSNDQVAVQTFGTAPNRQHWVLFSSYSATGTSGSHWTYWSVVLEETTNNIYIVDQRTAGWTGSVNIGVRVDASNLDEITGVTSGSTNAPDRSDNTHYGFIQGVQPDYEMQGVSVNLSNYLALTSAPFTISADFVNNGAATISSADLNVSINGAAPTTTMLSSLNIGSGGSATLSQSAGWTPSSSGAYSVEAWLSNLNGTNVDSNPANDTAMTSVQVVPALTTRYPLYETFTSSTCPPCAPANTQMESVFALNPGEYSSIKYQMSWPGSGDPYYTTEGGDRRTYYGINSVPRVEIDGGWDNNGNNVTQAVFDQFQNVPAFVQMAATFSQFSKTVETTVDITSLADINSSNLALFAVIYEHATYNNVGTNGETEFINVVKKMMPSAQGQSLGALSQGATVSRTLSYTFNGSYTLPPNANSPANLNIEHTVEDFENLGVIAWIQDLNTKEIFQSVDATYTIGQFENELAAAISIYPNPATDFISVEGNFEGTAQVQLVSLLGQEIQGFNGELSSGNTLRIPTEGLAKGTYLVVVSKEGTTHAEPVVIR